MGGWLSLHREFGQFGLEIGIWESRTYIKMIFKATEARRDVEGKYKQRDEDWGLNPGAFQHSKMKGIWQIAKEKEQLLGQDNNQE